MFKSISIFVLLLSLSAIGCSKSGSGDSAPGTSWVRGLSSPFLEKSDLEAPSGLEQYTLEEALGELVDADDVYVNEPEDEEDGEEACLEALIDRVLVRAEGNAAVYGIEADASACMQDALELGAAGSPQPEITAVMKGYFKIECDGEDLSHYNGKKVGDVECSLDADNKSSQKSLWNIEIRLDVHGTILDGQGKKRRIDAEVMVIRFKGDEDGDACRLDEDENQIAISNNCIIIETLAGKLMIDEEEAAPDANKYHTLKPRDLKEPNDDVSLWYLSGAYDFEFNNWTGSLVYSSAEQNPSYHISDGVDDFFGVFDPDAIRAIQHRSSVKMGGFRLGGVELNSEKIGSTSLKQVKATALQSRNLLKLYKISL